MFVLSKTPCLIATSITKVTPPSGYRAKMFDYCDTKHLKKVIDQLKTKYMLASRTASSMIEYEVFCNASGLTRKHFGSAAVTARFTDYLVGNTVANISVGNTTVIGLPKFTTAKLVRAVLGMKFAYEASCSGENFEWSLCGAHEMVFEIPLLSIDGTLLTMQLLLECRSH